MPELNIYEEECCSCGITFYVTKKFQQRVYRDKSAFHCPNGHRQSYTGDTEQERLRKLLDDKNNEIIRLEVLLKKKNKKKK